jgi:hypothetical protein
MQPFSRLKTTAGTHSNVQDWKNIEIHYSGGISDYERIIHNSKIQIPYLNWVTTKCRALQNYNYYSAK